MTTTPILQGSHKFGFYIDIAGLTNASRLPDGDGSIAYERGELFIGEAATSNAYYRAGQPQTVRTWDRLHGKQEKYWSFQMQTFELHAATHSTARLVTTMAATAAQPAAQGGRAAALHGGTEARAWRRGYTCAGPGACIVDSGNPALELPAEIHSQLVSLGDGLGDVVLTLHLVDGAALALPGTFLKKQLELGYLNVGAGVVLGLPLSELFYIVFGAPLRVEWSATARAELSVGVWCGVRGEVWRTSVIILGYFRMPSPQMMMRTPSPSSSWPHSLRKYRWPRGLMFQLRGSRPAFLSRLVCRWWRGAD